MTDKRDECGCHRPCQHPTDGDDILAIPAHTCANQHLASRDHP